jgi:hypothetical protein
MNYKNPNNFSIYCRDYSDITLEAACAYPAEMTNVTDADGSPISWDAAASTNTGRPLYDDVGNCWDDTYDPANPPPTPSDPFPEDCPGHSIVTQNDVALVDKDGISVYNVGRYTRDMQLWDSFVKTVNLKSDQGEEFAWYDLKDATSGVYNDSGYRDLTMYFNPSCEEQEIGGSGGDNFGVRAEEPVLVF